ncbi:MAG: transposase [Rhodanobacteraceae bacterium]|nr:transposase [Rhodanobacteraceae bacterium]
MRSPLPTFLLAGTAVFPRLTLSRRSNQCAISITPIPCASLCWTRYEGQSSLKEPDKPPQSASYLWVQTGSVDQRTVVLFDYDTRRSADAPCRLLPDWQGTLMTDAYGAYNAIAAPPGVVHLNCLAHARRLFIDAQRAQPKGKTSKADVALNLIAKLYAIERQIRDTTDALHHHARTTQSQPSSSSYATGSTACAPRSSRKARWAKR